MSGRLLRNAGGAVDLLVAVINVGLVVEPR
jgi:hypothetical protein